MALLDELHGEGIEVEGLMLKQRAAETSQGSSAKPMPAALLIGNGLRIVSFRSSDSVWAAPVPWASSSSSGTAPPKAAPARA